MVKTFADVLKWDEFKHQRDKDGRFAATPIPRDIVQVYGMSAFPEKALPETMDQIEARAYSMRRRSERIHLEQDATRPLSPIGVLTTNAARRNAARAARREQHKKSRLGRMMRSIFGS